MSDEMTHKPSEAVEICARFSIREGAADKFREAARACVERVLENEPDTLRYDWFIDQAGEMAMAMDAYAGPRAVMAHLNNQLDTFPAVMSQARAVMAVLGDPGAAVREAIGRLPVRQFSFLAGLEEAPAARRFGRGSRGGGRSGGDGHIEIVSEFAVRPECWQRFCELAGEHLAVVRERDPGTLRYDWFVDEAGHSAIALDTYADSAAMFAHMRNCADIHHEFQELGSMTTDFLGALPQEAAAAVAKFRPHVLPFFVGLKSHSAGGFD